MEKTAQDIIVRPIITENSMDALQDKKYTFEVDIRANKTEIKNAVEKIFGVKVKSVNTLRTDGKEVRRGRFVGTTSEVKKAIVALTADSKGIEFFDGMVQ